MWERLQRYPFVFSFETADRNSKGRKVLFAWLNRKILRRPARRSRAAPDLPPEGAFSDYTDSWEIGRLLNIARRATSALAPPGSAAALIECKS